MLETKLSSKEKRRLERCINNVQKLEHIKRPTDIQRFIKKRQVHAILVLLGYHNKPSVKVMGDALDIINDWKPFKIRRLYKLIYGRRSR
jgi:hypothetical protein